MKKKIFLIGSILALAILCALVILPHLLRSRMTYDPETPLSDLRTITLSLILYRGKYNCYPANLKALGPPPKGVPPSAEAADLIDDKLASGSKLGYRFTYRPFSSNAKGPLDRFNINADPISGCSTGCPNYSIDEHAVFHSAGPEPCMKDCSHYFMDHRAVIHVETNSTATAKSPQIDYSKGD